jgi:D-alanyl-D-alanine carboxypeptidase
MNHTSGIPSWEDDPRWLREARGADVDPGRRWQAADSLAYIDGKPALSPPGAEYHYSNTNYTLLGLVIEAVTGQSFTTARPGLLDVSDASLAPEWAAGGLVTTAHDLASFALALRDGRLLTRKQLAFMQTWRPAEDGLQVGHGLFRSDRGNGRYTLGHQGSVLGFAAQMEWLEKGDAVFVSLSNVGSIDAGEVPLDRHAALPLVLASFTYLASAKATACLVAH